MSEAEISKRECDSVHTRWKRDWPTTHRSSVAGTLDVWYYIRAICLNLKQLTTVVAPPPVLT